MLGRATPRLTSTKASLRRACLVKPGILSPFSSSYSADATATAAREVTGTNNTPVDSLPAAPIPRSSRLNNNTNRDVTKAEHQHDDESPLASSLNEFLRTAEREVDEPPLQASAETNRSSKMTGARKKADAGKKADTWRKADTGKKVDTWKKADTEKKADTKRADSGKKADKFIPSKMRDDMRHREGIRSVPAKDNQATLKEGLKRLVSKLGTVYQPKEDNSYPENLAKSMAARFGPQKVAMTLRKQKRLKDEELEKVAKETTTALEEFDFNQVYSKMTALQKEKISRERSRRPDPSDTAGSWGPDRLAPQASEMGGRPVPPHTPEYSKAIQGSLPTSNTSILQDVIPELEHRPIATLAHGLDRVLFNPGVHWLRDPRSNIYNFTPWLEKIPQVNDFAFNRIAQFTKSSQDTELWSLAKREGKTFVGSTSSLSGLLSQAYFLISDGKEVDTSVLSKVYRMEPRTFTPSQRMPVSVFMKHNEGVYAIDSHKTGDVAEKNILLWMGTLLEKFLTAPPAVFKNYLRSSPGPIDEENDDRREAFRFASTGNFVMRSQLDCMHKHLPGSGVFDIKTRACAPIRMDILNYQESSGYLIRKQHGILESFEREYYDLIRSAFLKYSFQARIGGMDGVIVAYHNTDRIFGFQYVPLSEMDERLYGASGPVGDMVFEKCVGLVESIMKEVIGCYPGEDMLVLMDTNPITMKMNVWVQPANWEGEEESRPIKQLSVKAANAYGDEPVRAQDAVSSGRADWKVTYDIWHLSVPESEMRTGMAEAVKRQTRSMIMPSGVGEDEMEAFWETLRFGGEEPVKGGREVAYKDLMFREANQATEVLRELARKGRVETLEREERDKGQPKIVLGMSEPWREE